MSHDLRAPETVNRHRWACGATLTGSGSLPVKCPIHGDCDLVCEHGTAMDVHCCNCHSGFIFDIDHECSEENTMTLSLHRCTICGTRWLLWPDAIHGGGWNLLDRQQRPGACCDNVAMGDQIEHLRDIPLEAAAVSPPQTPEERFDPRIAMSVTATPAEPRKPRLTDIQRICGLNTVQAMRVRDYIERLLARPAVPPAVETPRQEEPAEPSVTLEGLRASRECVPSDAKQIERAHEQPSVPNGEDSGIRQALARIAAMRDMPGAFLRARGIARATLRSQGRQDTPKDKA